jgi:hypothetical protein
MITTLIAFITGYMLSWYGLGGLFFVGILFEYCNLSGWAVFTGILTALTAYLFFSIPILNILVGTGVYLVVGILWSFWRYKRFITNKVKNLITTSSIKDYHPNKMISTITYWILIWPFSIAENICGDLIKLIESFVKNALTSIFMKIYNSATSQLNLKS